MKKRVTNAALFARAFLKNADQSDANIVSLLADKVIAVLGTVRAATQIASHLSAADVLAINSSGPRHAERNGKPGHLKFRGWRSLASNNASIIVVAKNPRTALWSKDAFSKKQWLLIAVRPWIILQLPTLFRHMKRKRLIPRQRIKLGRQTFLCFQIECNVLDNHRQFYPLDSSPRQFLESLKAFNYVLLHGEDKLDRLAPGSDIDLLVEGHQIADIIDKNQKDLCTQPMDIYSHDGSNGFYFNRAPYVTPKLAQKLLSEKRLHKNIHLPSPEAQFLSDQFAILFQQKSRSVPPGSEIINAKELRSTSSYDRLYVSAKGADRDMPVTFSDIEANLMKDGLFPEVDLLGFYCVKNPFLQRRYLTSNYKPGLATFFIRDFGNMPSVTANVRNALLVSFDILLEMPLTGEQQEIAANAIRGGNWADPEAEGGVAKPVYLFVCVDRNPQKPSRRTKRKHPLVDNENNRIKEAIREQAAPERRKALRMIHGSDNTQEAVAHMQSLGCDKEKEIAHQIDALSKSKK